MNENKYLTVEIQRSNVLYCDILHYSFLVSSLGMSKIQNQLVLTFKEHFQVRFSTCFS